MLQWLTHIGLRVTRKYKKITILLQIGFHHIIECPMCTTTLLLTMYYYLELLKYLTWSVSVSTQQQNVYKTTRKFPCTNMQAFLKWWLSFQYRTTPIFFSFRVCFQKKMQKYETSFFAQFLCVDSKMQKWNRGRCFSFKYFQSCTVQKSINVLFARKWSANMWYFLKYHIKALHFKYRNIKGGIYCSSF